MPGGRRQPKYEKAPKPRRSPKAGGDPDAYEDATLKWRMRYVDLEGRWGWGLLGAAHSSVLHRQILDYETTPIRTLRSGNRLKPVPVRDLCQEAKVRLRELELEEVEEIYELRLAEGRWRIWALLELGVIYPVWWDPEHTVCRGRDRAVHRNQ